MEPKFETYKDDRTGLSTTSKWSTYARVPYDSQEPDVKVCFRPCPYAMPHQAFYLEFGTSMDTKKPRTGSISLTTKEMRELAQFLNEQADLIDEKAKQKDK